MPNPALYSSLHSNHLYKNLSLYWNQPSKRFSVFIRCPLPETNLRVEEDLRQEVKTTRLSHARFSACSLGVSGPVLAHVPTECTCRWRATNPSTRPSQSLFSSSNFSSSFSSLQYLDLLFRPSSSSSSSSSCWFSAMSHALAASGRRTAISILA